jgi:hypothetical protein
MQDKQTSFTKYLSPNRIVKCPFCKKYVFLDCDDKFSKHYKSVAKNLICQGSGKENEESKNE